MCALNVILRGRSVQCCTCSKWVHLKCSLLSFSKFRALGTPCSWSCSHCCVPTFSRDNTVTSSSDSSSLYTSTVQFGPSAFSANAALPPHHRLQTSYPSSAYFASSPSAPSLSPHSPGCLSTPRSSFFLLTPSGFFNGTMEVLEPGALNFYTFFRFIPLTLFISKNLILIHLPLARSLDSLLCDLIAPTPSLAFFLLMPRTIAAATSFLSGKAYPSRNFLPPLFFCLTPTLIM